MITAIILTQDSKATIEGVLASLKEVAGEVYVVDSGSTDGTVETAEKLGAHVYRHEFASYGAQRRWAMENLPIKGDWELHLDADERLSPELASQLREAESREDGGIVGYFLPRLVVFLGRPIRRGGMYPIWHMRFFRKGMGRCEERLYDQHFYVEGPTAKLNAPFIDDCGLSLSEYVSRHNRWADAEAAELAQDASGGRIKPAFLGNPTQRKRFLRGIYERAPLFFRALALFVYRYFFRLGFLDGREGLIFFVLQTFWFRFLVDAKLYEKRIGGKRRDG